MRWDQIKRIWSVEELGCDTSIWLTRVKIDNYRNELCSHIRWYDFVFFAVDLLLEIRPLVQVAWWVCGGDCSKRRGAYWRRRREAFAFTRSEVGSFRGLNIFSKAATREALTSHTSNVGERDEKRTETGDRAQGTMGQASQFLIGEWCKGSEQGSVCSYTSRSRSLVVVENWNTVCITTIILYQDTACLKMFCRPGTPACRFQLAGRLWIVLLSWTGNLRRNSRSFEGHFCAMY